MRMSRIVIQAKTFVIILAYYNVRDWRLVVAKLFFLLLEGGMMICLRVSAYVVAGSSTENVA
jgi:hypothetical protein